MRRLAIIVAVAVDLVCLAAVQAAPDVKNNPGPVNKVAGEALLQGKLVGGGPADVCIYWGLADGGTTAASWAHKSPLSNLKNGSSFSVPAGNLTYGLPYYYRCFASNARGEAWAPASTSFTTLRPSAAAPGADNRAVLTVKSGLACWYDAAVGVTADAKGVVHAWKDLSGNNHYATLAAGAPVLAQNQINSKPAIQFRTSSGACGLNIDGPFVVEQQYVVVRSPNDKWSSDGCFLGRRWKRASSYRLSGKSSAFWGDQYPVAVSRNGKKLKDRPFYLAPITEYMILKINVNDGDLSRNTYQIGMADLASCDFDVAEIIGFQTVLSPSDEELVGGYLAAKYGIATDYPANAGMASACTLTTAPATVSTSTSAALNATLACPGAVYDIRVYWGTTDGGTDADLWENSAPVGTWTGAASTKASHTVTGLTPGATYYYTFRGTNAVDSFWADKVLSFRAGGAATGSPTPKLSVTKGLACWFDAAVGVTADDKGAVKAWKDLSGKDHNAATGGGASPVLAADQINSKPAIQFRKGWLGIDGTFFAKEHYIVIRSPNPKWSGASGLLGRLKGRGSSYNTWGNDTGFWTDVSPAAVSRNAAPLPGPAFDCSPMGKFMVLKVTVNNANQTEAAYAIGNNDGLTHCYFDVAEILGYESILSPADEAMVGGYLAAKYGIDTAYPPLGPANAPELPAGELAAAKYKAWKHSGSMFLLTTPEGANLPAAAAEENFPVLVQLSKDWFNFSQAKANGEDIRFATSSGVPMACQIDQWDPAGGTASIWVRVPTIKGDARQEIKMYWGNADAKSESSGPAVFNKSNGYLSVWHMNDPVQDDAGTVESTDLGTTSSSGMIGLARHFDGGKGIFCGDRITKYPFASSPHTTETWVKAEKLNSTLVSWNKMDGATLRVLSTPSRASASNGRSSVHGTSVIPTSQWFHLVYTYDGQYDRLYVDGRLDIPAPVAATPGILTPVRMQIGNGFVGDLDEVRVSKLARSADWVRLQYENQKPLQTLVGPLVQSGTALSASDKKMLVLEGKKATVTVKAGGAQKIYWSVKNGDTETITDVDRFSYTVGGRVTGDQSFTLRFKAIYADGAKTLDIPVTIQEDIPDPVFTLKAPADWDGRETIEVVPQISNLKAMQAKGAAELKYDWAAGTIAAVKDVQPGKLILKRARNSGKLVVTASISNGGKCVAQTVQIAVKEPAKDPWVYRTGAADEKPVDNQFYARDDKNEGTLFYNGTLAQPAGAKPAEAAFLKLYADDKLVKTETRQLKADKAYAFSVPLKAGLIKYKVEFGTKTGADEKVLHTASNLVCGDAFLLDGQSNTVAESWGADKCEYSSQWIRSFGSMGGDGGAGWGNAVRRGGPRNIGYWGMDLASHLVETQKIPICVINGAVGGTRIDQHKRGEENPNDPKTIYGRYLTRIQQAGLTHGIRAVLWHQGEADQGTDGPDGGYGWETYVRYWLNMTAAWKQDMPNIQHYYMYQIWPNACGQGGNRESDKFRDVQRLLPHLYSNMSAMSTLGIKPEGPCHYPPAGYAEMARLMIPLVERDIYGKTFDKPITAPDLKRACYTSAKKDEIALEFDQPMAWNDATASQLYLDGKGDKIASGTVSGNVVTLKLTQAGAAQTITYITDRKWDSKSLLYGKNGIAALTFCEVKIETSPR